MLEEETAMEELLMNNAVVEAYNAECKISGCDFVLGLWSNSDWSDAKKDKNLCGSEEQPAMELRSAPQELVPIAGNTKEKNWVNDGRVFPVVNQQSCGCCWVK